MSTYEILLFAHILFVVAWVGTDIAMQLVAARARAAGPAQTADFLATVDWIGKVFLAPVSILVVVFGALLVTEAGYEFSQAWIMLAFAGFIFSFILGAGFLGPESARVHRLIAERGAEDDEVQSRIRRMFWASRVELAVLVAIIADMVFKPGL